MTEEKIWGIFDKRPLIWLHYLILEIIIVVGAIVLITLDVGTILFFIILFLLLAISDQLIHYFLGVD